MHVIITHDGRLIEVQVRTALQHLWAELSEKLSDVFDPAIKYGGGRDEIREFLAMSSELANDEKHGAEIARIARQSSRLDNVPNELKQRMARLRRSHSSGRKDLERELREFIKELTRQK